MYPALCIFILCISIVVFSRISKDFFGGGVGGWGGGRGTLPTTYSCLRLPKLLSLPPLSLRLLALFGWSFLLPCYGKLPPVKSGVMLVFIFFVSLFWRNTVSTSPLYNVWEHFCMYLLNFLIGYKSDSC